MEEVMRGTAPPQSGSFNQDDNLIDIKVGKLTPFPNREEEWPEWSSRVRSGMAAVSPEAASLLESLDGDPNQTEEQMLN